MKFKFKLFALLTISTLSFAIATSAHAGGYYGDKDMEMDTHSDTPDVEMDRDTDMDMDSGTEIDIESESESSTFDPPQTRTEEIIEETESDYDYRYDLDSQVEVEEKVVLEVEAEDNFGRNYIGGVYKGDDNDFGVIGKLRAVKLSDTASLSFRPASYFDGDRQPELRLPITLDGKISDNLTGYVGGGIDIDFEGDTRTQGLVTGGLDVHLGKFVVGGGLDYLTSDDDLQGKVILGIAF